MGRGTALLYGTVTSSLPRAHTAAAFVFFFLRGKRERIKYSQIMRAKGLHGDRLVHRYYVWNETWSRLFYFYGKG